MLLDCEMKLEYLEKTYMNTPQSLSRSEIKTFVWGNSVIYQHTTGLKLIPDI